MRKLIALSVVTALTLAVSPVSLLALGAPAKGARPAPQDKGIIRGTAHDASKNALSGAKVQLVDSNGNVISTTTSASNGTFTMTGVTPGTYSINVVTSVMVDGVATDVVVGTVSVTVLAGTVATISIATTAVAALAAASGGILAGTSLLVIGGIAAGAGTLAYVAIKSDASQSR